MLDWLHTDGGYVKDKAGKIVSETGVVFPDLGYGVNAYGEPQDPQLWFGSLPWRHGDPTVSPYAQRGADAQIDVMAKALVERWAQFGARIIRFNLNMGTWKNRIPQSMTPPDYIYEDFPLYIPQIDAIVNECVNNDIYLILQEFWHTTPENVAMKADPTEWINWLVEVAERYKNIPNVCAIDIRNEPRDLGDELWNQYATQACVALNAANPNVLKFVSPDPPWSQGINQYWLANPIPVPNVVYAIHGYYFQQQVGRDYGASYAAGNYEIAKAEYEQSLTNMYLYAQQDGFPMMQVEFGMKADPALEPAWEVALNDFLSILNKHNVGWTYLSWGDSAGFRYGMLERDAMGFYTVLSEPKAGIIQANLTVVPVRGWIQGRAWSNGTEVFASVEIVEAGRTETTPFSIELDVGTYTLNATYEDKTLLPQTVEVFGGQTIDVTFNFTAPPIPPEESPVTPLLPRMREMLYPYVPEMFARWDELRAKGLIRRWLNT